MEKETMKWQKTNMCTQDIFMHKNNVTQMIYASDIKEFKEFCNESLKILRSGGSSVRYWIDPLSIHGSKSLNLFHSFLFQLDYKRKYHTKKRSCS